MGLWYKFGYMCRLNAAADPLKYDKYSSDNIKTHSIRFIKVGEIFEKYKLESEKIDIEFEKRGCERRNDIGSDTF